MLLTVDIGNSSIDFGAFDSNGTLRMKSKVSAVKNRSADEYAVLLKGVLQLHAVLPEEITAGIIASVVPPLTVKVSGAIHKLFGIDALEIGPGIKTGLKIQIDSQSQLGADIVANAVAAMAEFPRPCVIVDIGTATTLTVIDQNDILQGVIIAPGMRMSLDALSSGASELPDVSIIPPKRVIGKNSIESMNIGAFYGHAFQIDGFLELLKQTLKTDTLSIVVTGGLADTLLPYCKTNMERRPNLTLEGLRLLYQKNEKISDKRTHSWK